MAIGMANQMYYPCAILRELQQRGIQQTRMNPGWLAFPGHPIHPGHSNQVIDSTQIEDIRLLQPVIAELYGPSGMCQTIDAQMLTHPEFLAPNDSLIFQDLGKPAQSEPRSQGPSSMGALPLETSESEPFEQLELEPLELEPLELEPLEPLKLDSLPLNDYQQEPSPQRELFEQQLNEFMSKVTNRLDR
ncbi:uncharacterized protein PV09_09734 [Verruconis gallopava]|uniref:Uncharacterized protein n=1 Tax=Verruconis gallopava TaxID=253628 RepID=A0A0D1X8U5_9PEZI|nr:uncharacterized protein PV09_09734 [Verruconis gallopava]KIV98455.1 hypothetical protein PV09_09734 [Verruconis gallopava]